MLRRLFVIGLVAVSVLASHPAIPQTRRDDVGQFRRTKAMKHVWRLANRIGVRVRGSENERRAASYVVNEFERLGYRVNVQEYPVDGKRSRNVVASVPGAVSHPFVVGGHMDTVSGSPGANDNASGVAIVLEMARLLRDHPKAELFEFVAFGSEEYGSNGRHHIGSEVFVDRLGPKGRERSPGMVSVDMVADGKPLIVGNSGIAGDIVADELYARVKDAGISVRYETACDCSDNGPFEHAGIPASYMWSGDEPNYHSPSDTVRNMKPEHLHRSGRAVRAFMLSLSRSDLRRFRSSH